jgi:membrane fusion protein, multidrug efflux system
MNRAAAPHRSPRLPVSVIIVIFASTALALAYIMLMRAEARTSSVSLAAAPKPVSYVAAKEASYRRSRHYVGTLRPWVEANVGPQFIAAYVDTVLVRPGAKVKHGEVLATLDCRNANIASTAVAMQAHAIEAKQKALSDESQRQAKLLDGGFASANEVEQALAESAAQTAQLESQKATLAHSTLEVRDCVLRAPFDGEVGDRFVDPGAFVRPGTAIVSVIDRSTVRFTGDVPEIDFDLVAPGTAVRIVVDATRQGLEGIVSRRAPHADPDARTVRFEVDLANPGRIIPVDTTGEVTIGVGEPVASTEIPLYAATVRGGRAAVFVVDGDVARSRTVAQLGEIGGSLFVEHTLEPGSRVVTEGRALLRDGDRVTPEVDHLGLEKAAPASSVLQPHAERTP